MACSPTSRTRDLVLDHPPPLKFFPADGRFFSMAVASNAYGTLANTSCAKDGLGRHSGRQALRSLFSVLFLS